MKNSDRIVSVSQGVLRAPETAEGSGRTAAPGESTRARLVRKALRQFVIDLVTLVYNVHPGQLLQPTRGHRRLAFARQVAMYLAHTSGGISLSAVGRLFGRDRTTVAHACALVEDARDDERFDRTLSHLERAIACQMSLLRELGGDGTS